MSNFLTIVPLDVIFCHNKSVIRAGVIPYAIKDDRIIWLMGQGISGRLGDFGGGCKSSRNETAYDCLIRETEEESSGVLTSLIRQGIQEESGVLVWRSRSKKDPAIYRYMVFVPVPYDDTYHLNFQCNKEVIDLKWVWQSEALDSRIILGEEMSRDLLISSLVQGSPFLKVITPSSIQDVSSSVHAIQGRRDYMEDTNIIHELEGISVYGVFDGHGGGEISKFLKDEFWNFLTAEFKSISCLDHSNEVKNAIHTTFLKIDRHLSTIRAIGQNHDPGSTAVIALKIKNKLYLGNLGDSRAIIFDSCGNLLASTKDHKPLDEQLRIEKAGGVVAWGRVNGNLAVSRAFGDFAHKIKDNRYMGVNSIVSPVPDVFGIDLLITGPIILVLASDGLWDVMSPDGVISRFKTLNLKLLAQTLVEEAYSKGSGDNITALVVKLLP